MGSQSSSCHGPEPLLLLRPWGHYAEGVVQGGGHDLPSPAAHDSAIISFVFHIYDKRKQVLGHMAD